LVSGKAEARKEERMEERRIGLMMLLTLAVLFGVPGGAGAQDLGEAIDISQGTGNIAVRDVECWVNSGVKHIIVKAAIDEELSGSNHNRDTSIQQLETLWRARYEEGLQFSVDIYLYLHWPNNPALYPPITTPIPIQVQEAKKILEELNTGNPPLPLRGLWIDLEEVPPWCTDLYNCDAEKTVNLIREALNECGSFSCGIYTREEWWMTYTGNAAGFAPYPLWYAKYRSCPAEPSFSDFEPVGDWAAPVGKQFDKGICLGKLCAKSVDYDTMYVGDLDSLPTLPDLSVNGIYFVDSPLPGIPTKAIAELANIGGLPSGVFNVKWFLDGVEVGYGSHESLSPGQVSSGNVRFDWKPTAGQHTLRFTADVDSQVREGNENNNSFKVTVDARGPR
jgi:hypothetical protein